MERSPARIYLSRNWTIADIARRFAVAGDLFESWDVDQPSLPIRE